MAVNRQFYVFKFNSSWLKEHKFNIQISFDSAVRAKRIIAIADNQMLRLIRSLTDNNVNLDSVEVFYEQRDKIKKQKRNKENLNKVSYLQDKIYEAMFIKEYAVVVIESNRDYDRMFDKGLFINGDKYVRASCSSAQGRTSRVVFVKEKTAIPLLHMLDNGRNKKMLFSPSKYNAYLGMSSSSTKIVSTPRFCIIPDCIRERDVKCWFVKEIPDKNSDDEISERVKTIKFNLFDGNGLITPEKAKQWAQELFLDYVPSQFCIRASWIKGMLNVFDIHKFCEEINNGNYEINTIYGNQVDLRDIDVILTESQFKLWNAYSSLESYLENCSKNKLHWGISLYTPKQDKDILELNYQFIQTLDLKDEDIPKLCDQTVDYFNGVSYNNFWYTILFLLGADLSEAKLNNFMNNTNTYWLKSLIVCPDLLRDKYIRSKIQNNIRVKMKNACMGKILADGNFQVIVPDSYAFMQHVCGQDVTGSIPSKKFYSNYWNKRNVKKIDCMRAPLTYLSEHVVIELDNNEISKKWFSHNYTGIITNVYDDYTLRFAGSDFDYDILATTNNEVMINNTFINDLPVVYDAPKPEKILFTPKDLQNADKFTFGSIIGNITNNATAIRTLMASFDKESKQYIILLNRMKMACKMQSAQIDKAKIGKKVKGIPTIWHKWNKILDEDSEETKKQKKINNSILCTKHPYFFVYAYQNTRKKYKDWKSNYETNCKIRYGINFNDLLELKDKTKDQKAFLARYKRSCPVVDNGSIMNKLCRFMETSINKIKNIIKSKDLSYINMYKTNNICYDKIVAGKVFKIVAELRKILNDEISEKQKNKFVSDYYNSTQIIYKYYRGKLLETCSCVQELVNYLIDIFYVKYSSYNKEILFSLFGREIYENVLRNCGYRYSYPVLDNNGKILYLGKKYSIKTNYKESIVF